MSGNRNKNWSRDAISALIEAYKEERCLYAVTHANYKNKRIRLSALERVLAAVNVFRPETDIKECTTKWSNLRNTFNQENAKLQKSMKSGVGRDDVYQPQLWYFPLLRFIENHVQPRKSMNSLDSGHSQPASTEPRASNQREDDDTQMPPNMFDLNGHMTVYEDNSDGETALNDTEENLSVSLLAASPASPGIWSPDRPNNSPTPSSSRNNPSPPLSTSSSLESSTASFMPPPASRPAGVKRKKKSPENEDIRYAGAVLSLAESLKQPLTVSTSSSTPKASSDPVDSCVAFIASTLRCITDDRKAKVCSNGKPYEDCNRQ